MSIYQDIIIDHYRNPRNFGKIENPSGTVSLHNPLCGDQIEMSIILDIAKTSDSELLRIYEVWAHTHNKALARILAKYGIIPSANRNRKIH